MNTSIISQLVRCSLFAFIASVAMGCGDSESQGDDSVAQSGDAVKGGKGRGKPSSSDGSGTGGGGVPSNYGGGYLEDGTYISFIKDVGTYVFTGPTGATIDFSQSVDGTVFVVTPEALFGAEILRNADGTWFLVQ